MQITAVRPQVRRSDRYAVYVDGDYRFSLSAHEVLALGLHPGQVLTAAELSGLQKTALFDKAYQRCLDLLARRMRSAGELHDYLRRKAYSPEVADQVVDRLRKRGYVDDLKFAQAWVDNRRLLKTTSRRRLEQELVQKQLSRDIIDQVLAADQTDERQVLRQVVAKKRRHSRYQDRQKLLAYLLRQGYNYDDITAVLEDHDDIS